MLYVKWAVTKNTAQGKSLNEVTDEKFFCWFCTQNISLCTPQKYLTESILIFSINIKYQQNWFYAVTRKMSTMFGQKDINSFLDENS